MKKHERLAEPDRLLRRTAMDALEVLRREAGFRAEDRAKFHIGLIRLSSGDKVGLVDIRFDSPDRKTVCCVSLPTSTHFSAIPHDLPVSRRFEIARLVRAQIDHCGHVRLNDGSQVRAVEIEPARLPIKPSNLDWHIVHLTLELVGAKHCYRSLREGVPPDQRTMVPDLHFLDVARLSGLALPPLRDITRYIVSRHKKVSRQQVANALQKFGIRTPRGYEMSISAPD
jgi:hypothetical protein